MSGQPADFCDKCFEAVLHEGEPTGTIETVDGHRVYQAIPEKGKYDDKVALIYCSDVFGIDLVNNKLIADSYAKAGFATYIPDYLNNDPMTLAYMGDPNFDREGWRARHKPEFIRPALDATIKKLKSEGVSTFYSVGYCFGGRYTVELGINGVLKAGAVAHPSQIQVPSDFEKLAALEPKVPFLFLTCETDAQFPPESIAKADEILGPLEKEGAYKRVFYEKNSHGFAVRGDIKDPVVKAAKEDSFKQAVEWFKKN